MHDDNEKPRVFSIPGFCLQLLTFRDQRVSLKKPNNKFMVEGGSCIFHQSLREAQGKISVVLGKKRKVTPQPPPSIDK